MPNPKFETDQTIHFFSLSESFIDRASAHEVVILPLMSLDDSPLNLAQLQFFYEACIEKSIHLIFFVSTEDTPDKPDWVLDEHWQLLLSTRDIFTKIPNIKAFVGKQKTWSKQAVTNLHAQRIRIEYNALIEMVSNANYDTDQLEAFVCNSLYWQHLYKSSLVLMPPSIFDLEISVGITEFVNSYPARQLPLMKSEPSSKNPTLEPGQPILWTLCMHRGKYLQSDMFQTKLAKLLSDYPEQKIVVIIADYLDRYNRNRIDDATGYQMVDDDPELNQTISNYQTIFKQLTDQTKITHEFRRWDSFLHDSQFQRLLRYFQSYKSESSEMNNLTEQVASEYTLVAFAKEPELSQGDTEAVKQALIKQSRRYFEEEAVVAMLELYQYWPGAVIYDDLGKARRNLMKKALTLPIPQISYDILPPVYTLAYHKKLISNDATQPHAFPIQNNTMHISYDIFSNTWHTKTQVRLIDIGLTHIEAAFSQNIDEENIEPLNTLKQKLFKKETAQLDDIVAQLQFSLRFPTLNNFPNSESRKYTIKALTFDESKTMAAASSTYQLLPKEIIQSTNQLITGFLDSLQSSFERIMTKRSKSKEAVHEIFNKLILAIASMPNYFIPKDVLKDLFEDEAVKISGELIEELTKNKFLCYIDQSTRQTLAIGNVFKPITNNYANNLISAGEMDDFLFVLTRTTIKHYHRVKDKYCKDNSAGNVYEHFFLYQQILDKLIENIPVWQNKRPGLKENFFLNRILAEMNWVSGIYYFTYFDQIAKAKLCYEAAARFYEKSDSFQGPSAERAELNKRFNQNLNLIYFHLGVICGKLGLQTEEAQYKKKALALNADPKSIQPVSLSHIDSDASCSTNEIEIYERNGQWHCRVLNHYLETKCFPLPDWIINQAEQANETTHQDWIKDYVNFKLESPFGKTDQTNFEKCSYLSYQWHNRAVTEYRHKRWQHTELYLKIAEQVLAHLDVLRPELKDNRDFLTREPHLCRSWIAYRRSLIAHKIGDYDKAKAQATLSVELAQKDSVKKSYPKMVQDTSRQLGKILLELGDFKDCVDIFESAAASFLHEPSNTHKEKLMYRFARDKIYCLVAWYKMGEFKKIQLLELEAMKIFDDAQYTDTDDTKYLVDYFTSLVHLCLVSYCLLLLDKHNNYESYLKRLDTCYKKLSSVGTDDNTIEKNYQFVKHLEKCRETGFVSFDFDDTSDMGDDPLMASYLVDIANILKTQKPEASKVIVEFFQFANLIYQRIPGKTVFPVQQEIETELSHIEEHQTGFVMVGIGP